MESGFSSVVKIADVSDFINPSQACILPFEKTNSKDGSQVILRRNFSKPIDEVKKVEISLKDCLACSGCVTTAEAILVQEQSLTKLIDRLTKSKIGVVTISPQSVCSIAVKRDLSIQQATLLISKLLRHIGAKYLIDSSFARLLTLSLSYEEFKENRQKPDVGPLLCAVCPGFVCYAEKTHGEILVPLLSRVRSPQAIMGSIVKDYLARVISVDASEIFHATIMPCFDKKLEASRHEFSVNGTLQVDCVISTGEIDELLERYKDVDFNTINNAEVITIAHPLWLNAFEMGRLNGSSGGTSGGYAEYILKSFIDESKRDLQVRSSNKVKNMEILEVLDGENIILKVAKCYGFRNIQNMVHKLKRGKQLYDYVEVMACPAGCANGSGQIRGATTESREKTLERIEELYKGIPIDRELEMEVQRLRKEWLQLNKASEELLFTNYKIINKTVLDANAYKW